MGTAQRFCAILPTMFEVLVFVYENYWRGDACPQREHLERKLSAVGFEAEEIHDALTWLGGLNTVSQSLRDAGVEPASMPASDLSSAPEGTTVILAAPSSDSMRVYSAAEQDQLGPECLGFITFLETSGVLPAAMREVVMDRAMAVVDAPVSIDDLKIIVLMVYWSFGQEPDALVLDELCEHTADRTSH